MSSSKERLTEIRSSAEVGKANGITAERRYGGDAYADRVWLVTEVDRLQDRCAEFEANLTIAERQVTEARMELDRRSDETNEAQRLRGLLERVYTMVTSRGELQRSDIANLLAQELDGAALKANEQANTPRFSPAIEAQGMTWWNGCTEAERAHWLKKAGSAAPADAWQAFRTSSSEDV